MAYHRPDLAGIQREVLSDEAQVRGQAMQDLLLLAKKDPGVRSIALPIFREALKNPIDGWSTRMALHGVELIRGSREAQPIRLALLKNSNPKLVVAIVQDISLPDFVPPLIDLLSNRNEFEVRKATVRKLGLLRDGVAFAALVDCLRDDALCPHVIESLGDLGDARAIPWLQTSLTDVRAAWPEDNHGPMLRNCDLAQESIKKISRSTAAHPIT
jgi:HEAT repeat protein